MTEQIAFVFLTTPKIEPLGVMYLGSIAKQCGWEVGYFVGNDPRLNNFNPKYICYSIMTGDQDKYKNLNQGLKARFPDAESIVGGPHATFFPDDLKWADHICRGEGEAWLEMLLLTGADIKTKNNHLLDNIPFPDRYFNSPVGHFITSRGCPYSCHYCFNAEWRSITELPKVRFRSVDGVVGEINSTDSIFVYFQDDCFGINIKWLREFAQKYRGLPYHCHIRPEMATPERVKLLKYSGCRSVHMAIESANEEIRRKLLNRKMSNDQIRRAVGLLHDAGIGLMTQNMIGLPSEAVSIHNDLDTLEFNIRLEPDYAWCSIYQPYPGTPLGEYCKARGLWDGDVSRLGSDFFSTSHLNFDPKYIAQLETLQKLFDYYVQEKKTPNAKELILNEPLKVVTKTIYDKCRNAGDIKLFGKEIVELWK